MCCTGPSVRTWREPIKIGAICTVTEDRDVGRVRLCDANAFKRAPLVGALDLTFWLRATGLATNGGSDEPEEQNDRRPVRAPAYRNAFSFRT
jgi:hypothetical protein